MTKDSSIVEDIQRIRHKISAKFDHGIDRYSKLPKPKGLGF